MIIVEGPDGAGKSTLVGQLAEEFNLPVHERASHGRDGPVSNLFEWAQNDVVSMPYQPLSIYDRHPLISEYVYGPICRATLPPGFATPNAQLLLRMMAPRVLVVMCKAPQERLRASVSDDRDMPGVTEHIERIASAYDGLRVFWPGQCISYDYTKPEKYSSLISLCRIYVAARQSERNHRD